MTRSMRRFTAEPSLLVRPARIASGLVLHALQRGSITVQPVRAAAMRQASVGMCKLGINKSPTCPAR